MSRCCTFIILSGTLALHWALELYEAATPFVRLNNIEEHFSLISRPLLAYKAQSQTSLKRRHQLTQEWQLLGAPLHPRTSPAKPTLALEAIAAVEEEAVSLEEVPTSIQLATEVRMHREAFSFLVGGAGAGDEEVAEDVAVMIEQPARLSPHLQSGNKISRQQPHLLLIPVVASLVIA